MSTKYIILFFVSLTFFLVILYIASKEYLKSEIFPLPSCDENEICIRFCCYNEHLCLDNEKLKNIEIENFTLSRNGNYKILKGMPCYDVHPQMSWSFTENGLLVDSYNHTYQWNEYCYFTDGDENIPLTCVPVNIIENLKEIYPYLMLSSLPFLITTLVIYGYFKDLRTTHGKCIMAYVLSLILMYSSLSVLAFFNHEMLKQNNVMCKTFGYLFMISIFMCFLWLNVMCYDVWKSIRSSTPVRANNRSSSKKFIRYCFFGFGVPAVISFIVIALNEFEIIHEEWKTGIGSYSCLISDPIINFSEELKKRSFRAQLIYLYGPISILLIINFGFYFATAYTIYVVQKQTKRFNNDGNSKHTKKEKGRFTHYIRLFLLMGLNWIIEIISYFYENSTILYIASLINCMQGVIVFTMFVMHKKVFDLFKKKNMIYTQNTQLSRRFASTRTLDENHQLRRQKSRAQSFETL